MGIRLLPATTFHKDIAGGSALYLACPEMGFCEYRTFTRGNHFFTFVTADMPHLRTCQLDTRPATAAPGDELTAADDAGAAAREFLERCRAAQQAVNELGAGPPEALATAPPPGLALHVPLVVDADLAVIEGVALLRKAMRDAGAMTRPVEVRAELVTALVVELPGRDPLLFTVTRP
jgi:hypothetical protein